MLVLRFSNCQRIQLFRHIKASEIVQQCFTYSISATLLKATSPLYLVCQSKEPVTSRLLCCTVGHLLFSMQQPECNMSLLCLIMKIINLPIVPYKTYPLHHAPGSVHFLQLLFLSLTLLLIFLEGY